MSSNDKEDLGSWEKHTKGIGLKLLKKFGFTGRLGAKGTGVSKPVEVVVRPTNQGLGFGDGVEAAQLKANKRIEAEWRGLEYIEEEEPSRKRKKLASEKLLDNLSWKKGKEKRNTTLLVDDYVNQYLKKTGDGASYEIIDMRQEHTRILTDLTDINVESIIPEKPKLGQELLYNLNIISEMFEQNVHRDSRNLGKEMERIKLLKSDVSIIKDQMTKEALQLKKMQKILLIITRIHDKMNLDVDSITLKSIGNLFITLHENFPEEFIMFGFMELAPALLSSVIKTENWEPFIHYTKLAEMHDEWYPALQYFESKNLHTLVAQLMGTFQGIIEKKFLPIVRRAVSSTEWDIFNNPDNCVRLMETLSLVLNTNIFEPTIDMLVLPKLKTAVSDWRPNDTTEDRNKRLIHTWIHPWLPLMKSKLSVIYPDIRRKMGNYLTNWHPKDPFALQLLKPWKNVFDPTSFENLLTRSLIPKLVEVLRSDLQLNLLNQDFEPFEWVMAWEQILPRWHLINLFLGEFVGKWLEVLLNWLRSAEADLGEISQWYSGWKGVFPDYLFEPEIDGSTPLLEPFNIALDMMGTRVSVESETEIDEALSKFDLVLENIQRQNYFSLVEKRKLEMLAQKRLSELKGNAPRRQQFAPSSVSFKEVVASFAEKNNVEFVPCIGKFYEGKQIWLFGKDMCYIEDNVIFVASVSTFNEKKTKKDWIPMDLDQLLSLAQNC